jgi:hypothetical protein
MLFLIVVRGKAHSNTYSCCWCCYYCFVVAVGDVDVNVVFTAFVFVAGGEDSADVAFGAVFIVVRCG